MIKRYHWENIRVLLIEGFSKKQLHHLCFDLPDFRAVYYQFAGGMNKVEMVAQILEHADQKLKTDLLLDWAKKHNPTRYEAHQPYTDFPASPAPLTADISRKLPGLTTPYRVGSWVIGSEFYDRSNLLQDILAGSAKGLWIIGNRRVGKTSLLRTAEYLAAASEQYLPLFWDMQGDTSEAQLLASLLEAIEYAQSSDTDQRWQQVDLPEDASHLNEALRRMTGYARQQQCHLLLLCDEIEGLNQLGQHEPRVLAELRRVIQHNPNVRAVLASTRRLSRLYAIQQQQDTSLFLEGLEPRYLAHFDDDTANQVICCTQSAHPLLTDDSQLAKIRFFSGNHPLILQKVCQQLFDPDTGTLSPFDENHFSLDDQLRGTFQQDFDSLTPDEAKVLLLVNSQMMPAEEIEQALPHLSKSGLHRILYDLTQLGFLRRIQDSYQAGNVLLGEWLTGGPVYPTPQGGVTNRMLHEVAQERVAALQRQLITSVRQLGRLELEQARQVGETRSDLTVEIEEYQEIIAGIEAELAELGQNIL